MLVQIERSGCSGYWNRSGYQETEIEKQGSRTGARAVAGDRRAEVERLEWWLMEIATASAKKKAKTEAVALLLGALAKARVYRV
jgi:hypothetical protein